MLADWWYASSLLRAREKDILDSLTLTRWAESGNREVFVRNIKDSAYGELFGETNLEDYETVLEKALFELYRELDQLLPDPLVVRLHRMTVDLNNIKMTIKSKLQELPMDWDILSDTGVFPSDEIYTVIFEKQYHKLPPVIAAALVRAEEEYFRSRNIQILDFILDSAFHDYRLNSLVAARGHERVASYYRKTADMENIKNMIRARRLSLEKSADRYLLLKGGTLSDRDLRDAAGDSLEAVAEYVRGTAYGPALEEGVRDVLENRGFVRFEKAADEFLLGELRPFRFVPSGPEVIEEYLRLKQAEIKNLKIVFIGLLNDIKAEEVRSRIREAH